MNKTDINKLNYLQGAVFPETLIVAKLIKKIWWTLKVFYHVHKTASNTYPVLDESNPHPPTLFI
jgi:hypothetical protein